MMNYDYTLQNTIPIVEFDPGGRRRIIITLKNTGTANWGPGTYLMVTDDKNTQTFLNYNSMIKSPQSDKTVKPGETASFSLSLQAGFIGGISTFEVFPFINGKTKIEKFINIPMRVNEADFSYDFVKMEIPKTKLKPGETVEATIQLKNTGSLSWMREGKNRARLGTENPRDHLSSILETRGTRLAALQERQVDPGYIGTFIVKIKAPAVVGTYREYYAPVMEGITWMPFKQLFIEITVYNQGIPAQVQGGGTTQDLTMAPGERKQVTLEIQNNSGTFWNNFGAAPVVFNVSTTGSLRLSKPLMTQSRVADGQKATLNMMIVAPQTEGSFSFKLTPNIGNVDLPASSQTYTVKVTKTAAGQSTTTTTSSATPAATTPAATTSSAQSTTGSTATPSDLIKIDLSFKGNPVISGSGEFALYDGLKFLSKFPANEKVSVTYDSGKYRIKGTTLAFVISNPPKFMPSTGTILRIDNYENRPSWDTSYNDNEYRGNLYVNYYQDALQVINELPIEDYLKGLAEINAKEPVEKIKAVIVLARSYAKYYITLAVKFPGAPFDLTDDPQRSQKYLGYGFEVRNPTGVKAVNDTKGIVVTYNGILIKTPYFSSDDGKTKSAQEVWGWTDTPYLQSVDDPGCIGKAMSGHGVGLSGCGSLYFANQGKTYDQIIKYYFKGVEVKKL